MIEFINALNGPDTEFLKIALIAGLTSSIGFGMVGSLVVAKRITYIASSIAHCVLAGIGLSLYLEGNYGITWFPPMTGAIVSALLAAIVIGWVTDKSRERADSLISAIMVLGMSTGLLLMAKTPGYVDPHSYLFGNILLISSDDLRNILIMDTIVVSLVILLYSKLLAVSFDEQFSMLRGINVTKYNIGFLCITGLMVVVMVRIVGIVLVIALLTIPAATASRYALKMWQMMAISILLIMSYVFFGMSISYSNDLPSGAVIVSLAGAVYVVILIFSTIHKKVIRKFLKF